MTSQPFQNMIFEEEDLTQEEPESKMYPAQNYPYDWIEDFYIDNKIVMDSLPQIISNDMKTIRTNFNCSNSEIYQAMENFALDVYALSENEYQQLLTYMGPPLTYYRDLFDFFMNNIAEPHLTIMDDIHAAEGEEIEDFD
jgi:hypothetical protein